MARELSLFLKPLEVAPEPGLASVDPRLGAIVDLADRGQYDAAADRALELAEEGIYDIRPLSFALYQAFIDGGVLALGQVFEIVLCVLGQNFEAIGPLKRRREHFDKRLSWLFETIADQLAYHEQKRTPTWDALRKGIGAKEVERVVREAERVSEALAADPYEGAAQRLGRLLGQLRAQAEALTATEEPVGAPPAESVTPPLHEAAPAALAEASAAPAERAPDALKARSPERARVEIVVSHHFLELVAKLRAFEALIDKGAFDKAAVVADDLQRMAEGIDPRLYFPELFARFCALVTKNLAPLSERRDKRDGAAWKALDQYYRVDLEGFLED